MIRSTNWRIPSTRINRPWSAWFFTKYQLEVLHTMRARMERIQSGTVMIIWTNTSSEWARPTKASSDNKVRYRNWTHKARPCLSLYRSRVCMGRVYSQKRQKIAQDSRVQRICSNSTCESPWRCKTETWKQSTNRRVYLQNQNQLNKHTAKTSLRTDQVSTLRAWRPQTRTCLTWVIT